MSTLEEMFIDQYKTIDAELAFAKRRISELEEELSNMQDKEQAKTQVGESEEIDNVDHPSHYTQGGIECIDAIRAALTPEEFRGYCKGNIIKYAWRERRKGGDEDLGKASWYAREATRED